MENQIPKHVSVVLDGNRRWAKAAGLPVWEGHIKALDAIENLVQWSVDRKIEYLTLYLFSTENWSRENEEIGQLMGVVARLAIEQKFPALLKMGAKINLFGPLDKFPDFLQEGLRKLVGDSANNHKIVVNFCLDYGARAEMVKAVKSIVEKGISADAINESVIENELWSAGMPDPDLMIRTGGARRLSNFLLWQQAYTELYFVDKYLPEFTEVDFDEALEWYAGQERRMGR
jgi:undecaprenyl diphosphate synthase